MLHDAEKGIVSHSVPKDVSIFILFERLRAKKRSVLVRMAFLMAKGATVKRFRSQGLGLGPAIAYSSEVWDAEKEREQDVCMPKSAQYDSLRALLRSIDS